MGAAVTKADPMSRLTRLPDWDRRMLEAIHAAYRQPFRWGQHDCALFVADVIEAMTGTDLAARYRGTYGTLRGAAGALRFGSLINDLSVLLGKATTDTRSARRGDVVAFRCPGWTLGIVVGDTAAAAGREGICYIGMWEWELVWAV